MSAEWSVNISSRWLNCRRLNLRSRRSLTTKPKIRRLLVSFLFLLAWAIPSSFVGDTLAADIPVTLEGVTPRAHYTNVPIHSPLAVIHPCGWGDPTPDSPIPLQSPFAPGSSVIPGGVGYFYGDGDHINAYHSSFR